MLVTEPRAAPKNSDRHGLGLAHAGERYSRGWFLIATVRLSARAGDCEVARQIARKLTHVQIDAETVNAVKERR
jgi:hypothetical protein